MAVAECSVCKIKHQRPVACKCTWKQTTMSDPKTTSASSVSQPVSPSSSEMAPTSTSAPPTSLPIGSALPLQAPVTQPGSVEAILNSTRREVDEHNTSSASNRSRVAGDDELLLELRAMNRNIALLVENAVDDKARRQRVENIFINVSATLINTSHSISMQLHIMQTNHVIYCNTQGRPIYTNANSPAQCSNRQPYYSHQCFPPILTL
jgi:hypothetical protein